MVGFRGARTVAKFVDAALQAAANLGPSEDHPY